MNWRQQAVHVARKDVRMSLGLLVVFCGLIIVATASTLGYVGIFNGFWSFLVFFVMTLCIANIVHADSPYRDNAFWMTKPFAPIGVMTGKWLFMAGLILIAGIGQAIGFAAHDIAFTETARFTGESLLTTASIVGSVFLFAALTSNLSTLLLTLIAVLLLNVGLDYGVDRLLGNETFTSEMTPPSLAEVLAAVIPGIAISVLLGAYLYRTRRRLVVLGILAVTTVTTTFTARLSASDESSTTNEVSNLPPVAGVELRASIPRRDQRPPTKATAFVGVQLSRLRPQQGYMLRNIKARVRMPDGRTVIAKSQQTEITLRDPTPQGVDAARQIRSLPPYNADPVRTIVEFTISPDIVAAIDNGQAEVTVMGELREFSTLVDASLALETGRIYVRNGRRMRIEKLDSATPALDVFVSEVGSNLSLVGMRRPFVGAVDYALTNATGSRVQPLQHQGSSSSSLNMVLFTRRARLDHASLRPDQRSVAFGPGREANDETWTQLIFYETKAVAASRVEVKAEPSQPPTN
jgi:hypothetical protein